AFERELGRADDRLVAEVDRAQAALAVERQELRARAEDRDPPGAVVGEAPEGGEEFRDVAGLADRVAADERAAVHDAVGEERAPARREEVALVAAEREEREAVVAVLANEPLREPPLRRRLPHA